MTIRFSLSVIVGVIVTLALFYLMQSLISGAASALSEDKIGNLVDFVRVKQDQDVQKKQRKPKKAAPARRTTT
jgi:protein TonB